MTTWPMATWPVAELDPVARLRVLAAARPGALFIDEMIDAPFDRVWAVTDDLEQGLPLLLPDVRSLRISSAAGAPLEGLARGHGGVRARFDIVLTPGWCLMQSRFLLGGMAAVPVGDRTRFAFLGAFRLPGIRLLRPAIHPLTRHYGPAVIRRLNEHLTVPPG